MNFSVKGRVCESGAWSIGSVRASGAVGPEFEPTFCHSLLSGGPWQDLVSSMRLEPLTSIRCVCGTKEWSQQPRRSVESTSEETQKGSSGAQQRSPGIHPKCRHLQRLCFHQRDEHHIEDLEWRTQLKQHSP